MFAGRNERAKPIERMNDLIAFEAEEKRADRWVGLVVEGRECTLAEGPKHQMGESTGGQSQDNRVKFGRLDAVAVSGDDFPRSIGNDVRHRGVGSHRTARQRGRDGLRQRSHTMGKVNKWRRCNGLTAGNTCAGGSMNAAQQ